MGSAILQEGRLADAQDKRIHFAKRSDMCSVDMKLLLLADAQESRFLAAEQWGMGNAILQEGRFADAQ